MKQGINLTKQQKLDVYKLVKGYELKNEKQELENKKIELEKEITLIKSELEQLSKEKSIVENETVEINNENQKLQETVKKLAKKLARAKSEQSMIQIQRISLYNENEQAKDERESLIEKKEYLQSFLNLVETSKEEEEDKEDSQIFVQVQKLNDEVSERCSEISNLKKLLDNSTNLIKKLQNERNDILKAVSNSETKEKNKSAAKKRNLSKNLDVLATQIIEQNEAISSAIKEQPKSIKVTEKATKIENRKQTQKEPQSPKHEQSSLQVTYVIGNLQEQIKNLTEENARLQMQLDESEDERESIFAALGIQKNSEGIQISEEIQKLKDEISNLKQLLEGSANTNVQLSKEHDEILQIVDSSKSAEEDEEECDDDQTSLLINLDDIGYHFPDSSLSDIQSPLKKTPQKSPTKKHQISIVDKLKKFIKEKDDRICQLEENEKNLQSIANQMSDKLKKLSEEHKAILQALYGSCENETTENDLNSSQLMEKLNTLNSSISLQNEKISSAIVDDIQKEPLNTSQSPPLSPQRRNRQPRPQNQVLAALTKIREDLKDAVEMNFDKDLKIEELENRIKEMEGNLKS